MSATSALSQSSSVPAAWRALTRAELTDAGYQAAVYDRLILTECGGRADGGYTCAADDRGGPTKYGMSLRFLAAECALHPDLLARLDADDDGSITAFDVQRLKPEDAREEYLAYFYRAPGFHSLPRPFNAALFDQGVNGGCRTAGKLLQRALNSVFRTFHALDPLPVDGAVGPATRTRLDLALSGKGFYFETLQALRYEAAQRYKAIVKSDAAQEKWLGGWLNRASELGHV